MADEINKKILFEVESNMRQLVADATQLNETLTEQLTQQKLLALQGKQNTVAYQQIASSVRLTKQAIRDVNREIDNSTRAFTAQGNSIQQNRNLLSVLTAQYVKMGQEEGKTSEKTIELGKQVDALTTKLKAQEKQVGQTHREVGNYADQIGLALSKLTGSTPGLQQFSGITQSVVKVVGFLPSAMTKAGNAINNLVGNGNPGRNIIQGFGGMRQSAAEATEAVEETGTAAVKAGEATAEAATEIEGGAAGVASIAPASVEAAGGLAAVTAGAVATGGAIAALVVIIAGAYEWFKSLGSIAVKSGQIFDGVKASAISFFNDLSQDKSLSEMGDDMKKAYNNAVELKKGMQALNAREMNSDELVANVDREISVNMRYLQNKKITLAQAKQIDAETDVLEKKRVKMKKDNAAAEYRIEVSSALNGLDLDEKTYAARSKVLNDGNIMEMQKLENHNKIIAGSTEKLHDIRMKFLAAESEADQLEQKKINRMTIIQQRFGKQSVKTANTETTELAQAEKGRQQVLQDKYMSTARLLALNQDAYAKELDDVDKHYAEIKYKEEQFIIDQEKLAKLAKTPAAKKQFEDNAAGGKNNLVAQNDEQNTVIEKATREHGQRMAALMAQSSLELDSLNVAAIQDQEERQKAALEIETTTQINALNARKKAYKDAQADNIEEMKTASTERVVILTAENQKLQVLEDDLDDMILQTQKNADQKQLDNDKQAAKQRLNAQLEANLLMAENDYDSKPNKADKDAIKAAKQAKLDAAHDESLQELIDHKITAEQFAVIDQQYIKDCNALDDQYRKDKLNKDITYFQQVADAGFNIIKNAISSQAQAAEVGLEKQKTFELNNQSLTSTQKAAINEKYRVAEGKAKVKEFKQNQDLQIAEAIINGAVAITKTFSEMGWPAGIAGAAITAVLTGLQITEIAAQKPPAYARGGLHYESDGRGGVLPGYSRTDNTNAFLRSGEAVVVSEAMKNPWARNMVSAINVGFGGRSFDFSPPKDISWFHPDFNLPHFADGGVFSSTYLPTTDNGLRPSSPGGDSTTVRLHGDDINSIAGTAAAAAAAAVQNINFPPSYVDVKDIDYQQNRLSVVDNRLNY